MVVERAHSFIHAIHIWDPTELEALGNHTIAKAPAPMGKYSRRGHLNFDLKVEKGIRVQNCRGRVLGAGVNLVWPRNRKMQGGQNRGKEKVVQEKLRE